MLILHSCWPNIVMFRRSFKYDILQKLKKKKIKSIYAKKLIQFKNNNKYTNKQLS